MNGNGNNDGNGSAEALFNQCFSRMLNYLDTVHCILISMQIDYSYFILMYIHVIVLFLGDEIDRVNQFSSPFLL